MLVDWWARCPIQSASCFWFVLNMAEPLASDEPGPEAPPVGNAWQVAQAASAISCEPGSALIAGFLLMLAPEMAPGAEPPAIVSAISTAGVARPSATPAGSSERR